MDGERAGGDGQVGRGLESDHDRSRLNRMGETLLDGEGQDLDSDVLRLRVEGGVEYAEEVPLDD